MSNSRKSKSSGKRQSKTPASGPPKRKGGAPRGNRNNMRHGLKAGTLPKDARYIEVRLNGFRRQLEDAVISARGEITLGDAACIQTAYRWERHAMLAQRWLTKAYTELKPTDRLAFSREISRASAERDKAIQVLRLDNDKEAAPWLLPAPDDKELSQ